MILRRYVSMLLIGTLLCWGAWVVVLWAIDPFVSGVVGFASFYATLFLAVLGTCTLLGFLFRRTFRKNQIAFRQIAVSIREGLFFAIIFVGALSLLAAKLLTWWVLLFLVAGFTILEFFFHTREA